MNTTAQPNDQILLRPYSLQELANLYGVCIKTVKRWMEPFEPQIGKRHGRYYTVTQVKVIFDKIGLPGVIQPGYSL